MDNIKKSIKSLNKINIKDLSNYQLSNNENVQLIFEIAILRWLHKPCLYKNNPRYIKFLLNRYSKFNNITSLKRLYMATRFPHYRQKGIIGSIFKKKYVTNISVDSYDQGIQMIKKIEKLENLLSTMNKTERVKLFNKYKTSISELKFDV